LQKNKDKETQKIMTFHLSAILKSKKHLITNKPPKESKAAKIPKVAAKIPKVAAKIPKVAAKIPKVAAKIPKVAAKIPSQKVMIGAKINQNSQDNTILMPRTNYRNSINPMKNQKDYKENYEYTVPFSYNSVNPKKIQENSQDKTILMPTTLGNIQENYEDTVPFSYDNINSREVPQNITYLDLVNLFVDELFDIEAIKLKGKAEQIAEEIAKKIIKREGEKLADYNKEEVDSILNINKEVINSILNKTIESNIQNLLYPQNEELLRKNLWNVWYKTTYGYVDEYKEKFGDKFDEITIDQAIKKATFFHANSRKPKAKSIGGIKKRRNKRILYGRGPRDHSPGNSRYQIQQVPVYQNQIQQMHVKYIDYFKGFLQKYVYNFLYKIFMGPYKPLQYNHSEISNELVKLQEKIINALPPGKDREKIEKEFDILDRQKINITIKDITKSIFIRRKLQKEIVRYGLEPDPSVDIYLLYTIYNVDNIIYKPFNNLYIYGMEIPEQFDRGKLLSSMFFLLDNMKITNYVDLHDCDGGTYILFNNIVGTCNPYDRSAEREMFDLAIKVLIKNKKIEANIKREYKNIKDIVDMTAGTILAWKEISELPVATIDNRTIIHCYAGKGRTGSVLLFLRLRDGENEQIIKARLKNPHFGYRDILELIEKFKKLFNSDPRDNELEEILDKNFWKKVVEEVFNTKTFFHIKLLRQRLNRIFYFLAKKYDINEFYLYTRVTPKNIIFQQIINELRLTYPNWDLNEIKKQALFDYDRRLSDNYYTDIQYEFSAPSKIYVDWNNLNSFSLRDHQNYVDGIIN